MGKRKWFDSIGESSRNERPWKKQRRRKQSASGDQNLPAGGPGGTNLTRPNNGTAGPCRNRVEASLHLSKNQRKRLRDRERKKQLAAADQGITSGNQSVHQRPTEHDVQSKDKAASSKQKDKALSRASIKAFSLTALVPRPIKRWHNDAQKANAAGKKTVPPKTRIRSSTPTTDELFSGLHTVRNVAEAHAAVPQQQIAQQGRKVRSSTPTTDELFTAPQSAGYIVNACSTIPSERKPRAPSLMTDELFTTRFTANIPIDRDNEVSTKSVSKGQVRKLSRSSGSTSTSESDTTTESSASDSDDDHVLRRSVHQRQPKAKAAIGAAASTILPAKETISRTAAQPPALQLTDVRSGLGSYLSIPAATGSVRTSFANKATSVPSHLSGKDIASSFKRFSAFLKGSNVDTSDDRSDDASAASNGNANDQFDSTRQSTAQTPSCDSSKDQLMVSVSVEDTDREIENDISANKVSCRISSRPAVGVAQTKATSDEESDSENESDSDHESDSDVSRRGVTGPLTGPPAVVATMNALKRRTEPVDESDSVSDSDISASEHWSPPTARSEVSEVADAQITNFRSAAESESENDRDTSVSDLSNLPSARTEVVERQHTRTSKLQLDREEDSGNETNDEEWPRRQPSIPTLDVESAKLMPDYERPFRPSSPSTPGTRTATSTSSTPTQHSREAGDGTQTLAEYQLPQASDLVLRRTTPPLLANAGISRKVLWVPTELGGTRSPSPQTLSRPQSAEHESGDLPQHPPDPFYIPVDERQDVMQAIDEITSDVFGSTRSLPASEQFEDSHLGETPVCEELPASSFSSPCLKKSKSPPRHLRFDVKDLLNQQDMDVIVCKTVQIDDVQSLQGVERVETSVPAEEVGLGGDSGDNGDSAAYTERDPVTSANAQKQSSSPPDESQREQPQNAKAAEVDGKDQPHSSLGIARVNGDSDVSGLVVLKIPKLSKKKRKMTGRTSKHFSPQKEAKRTRPSRQRAAVAPVELSLETEVDSETSEFVTGLEHMDEGGSDVTTVDASKASNISSLVLQILGSSPRRPRTRSSPLANNESGNEVSNGKTEHEQGATEHTDGGEQQDPSYADGPPNLRQSKKKKRKSTGKKSTYFTPEKPALDPNIIDRVDFYNTTGSGRKRRVPAGVSIAPIPSINSEHFGIIQEKLWQEPFWLLIATTFLNQTTGRAAVPTFWAVKGKYSTPEGLAAADQKDLLQMIGHLGLQNMRSKRMIAMAQAWIEQPPVMGRRYRRLNYPNHGDGKVYKPDQVLEEDSETCEGMLEIANIPGSGPYAYDSWRMFCRDVLRGVAEDYNRKGATAGAESESFEPEWKRVLPKDKELRACLRWMWLREGWIWNCLTGERRAATEEESRKAVAGEMEVQDGAEWKFAARAAGVEGVVTPARAPAGVDEIDCEDDEGVDTRAPASGPALTSEDGNEMDSQDEDDALIALKEASRAVSEEAQAMRSESPERPKREKREEEGSDYEGEEIAVEPQAQWVRRSSRRISSRRAA